MNGSATPPAAPTPPSPDDSASDVAAPYRGVVPGEAIALGRRDISLEDTEERIGLVLWTLSRLQMSVLSTTEVVTYDNRDYRALDESSDLAVATTDDRTTFGHSDVFVDLGFSPTPWARFDMELKYDIVWPDDNLSRSEGTSGSLSFYELSINAQIFPDNPGLLELTLGRQPFEIGGVPHDYMLAGTTDSVTISSNWGAFGRIRVLAVDFFGGNDLPQLGYRFYEDSRNAVAGLRGETITYRTGVVYETVPEALPINLTAKAYYFYSSIGGGPVEESGADITYGGLLGNYRDADYQHMFGVRAAYAHDFSDLLGLNAYAEFARSMGVDRKAAVARDVATDGNAFGGGLQLFVRPTEEASIQVRGSFYHFDGGKYASDGLEFERGFVSFKGDRVGGLNLYRLSAWRPSAHIDAYGVVNEPNDISRSSGTQFINAGLEALYKRFLVRFDWWMYTDTSQSLLIDNGVDIDTMPDPPFGYTREEFRAQERFGKTLGNELSLMLLAPITRDELFQLWTQGGVFLPGDFYSVEVGRVAGGKETALGSADPQSFWALSFGGKLEF